MKNLVVVVLCTFFVIACFDKNDPAPVEKIFYFIDSSSILKNGSGRYYVDSGTSLVFRLTFQKGMNNEVYDDEHVEGICFEVDRNATSFNLKNKALEDVKCHYFEFSAWTRGPGSSISHGIISGKKLSDQVWEIEMDVKVDSLEKTFKEKCNVKLENS